MDESRLNVTVRLPELPERIVRETFVGAGAGFAAPELKISWEGRFTTFHFSPAARAVVFAAMVFP